MKKTNGDMNQQNNFGGSEKIPAYKYILAVISALIIISFIVLTVKGKLTFNFIEKEEPSSSVSSSETETEPSSESTENTTESSNEKVQSKDEKDRFDNLQDEETKTSSVTERKRILRNSSKKKSTAKTANTKTDSKTAKTGTSVFEDPAAPEEKQPDDNPLEEMPKKNNAASDLPGNSIGKDSDKKADDGNSK